jgi:hypothetical protein
MDQPLEPVAPEPDDDLALVLVKACVLLVMEREPLPPVIEPDEMLDDLVRLCARVEIRMQTLLQQARRWSLSPSCTHLPRLPTTHHGSGGTVWTCPRSRALQHHWAKWISGRGARSC